MRARLFSSIIFFLLVPFLAHGQDLNYARKNLSMLTSPAMFGRGYVNHGDQKAANYIASEFTRLGLSKFGQDYFQPYSFPINTFPGKVEVQVDGKTLVPGADFIVAANSRGISGTFGLVWIMDTSLSLPQLQQKVNDLKMKDKFLVTMKHSELVKTAELENVKGVILLEEKGLTWSISAANTTRKFVVIEVLKDKIALNAQMIILDIENDFVKKYETRNVIGYIKGSEKPDSFLVFSAHYDHLGKMGPALFPGANDNASGTSMILDLARYYSMPENKPRFSIAFMAFSGEEAGLLGSAHYVSEPLFPLKSIRFLINLDMVGTGSKGIKVVNGASFEKEFNILSEINKKQSYLSDIGKRGPSAHSDHHPFFEKGVPAIFIYTIGDEFKEYHNIYDIPGKLPFTKYNELFHLLTDFAKTF